MKHLKRLMALSMTIVMAGGLLAGCGGKSAGDSGEAGSELVMATNAAFPPYEFVDSGEYKGIDVEIAGKIAEKLDRELVIQDVAFDSIIAGVQSGKYDMGMAGMTVTDERKQSVNFSDTYATGIQSIIVKKGSAIKTVDDLSKKTRIGVQQGTTGDLYASDDYGSDAVTKFKNGADAVQALVKDKVDCVIIDDEPAKSFVEANEGLEILKTSYTKEDYAICMAKENDALLKQVNEALAELKADGEIDKIVGKYITTE